jgi:hypothetical protein
MYESINSGIVDIMNTPDFAHTNASSRRFQAIKEHLFSKLNNEAVILSLKNGKYYGLNAVGVSIWAAIQESRTTAEIETIVKGEYEVDHETCRREIREFLDTMLAEELIESGDE